MNNMIKKGFVTIMLIICIIGNSLGSREFLHRHVITNWLGTSHHTYEFSMEFYRKIFENTEFMRDVPLNFVVEDYGDWFPGVFYSKMFHRFLKTGDFYIHWSHNYMIGQSIGIGEINMNIRAVNAYRDGTLWVW